MHSVQQAECWILTSPQGLQAGPTGPLSCIPGRRRVSLSPDEAVVSHSSAVETSRARPCSHRSGEFADVEGSCGLAYSVHDHPDAPAVCKLPSAHRQRPASASEQLGTCSYDSWPSSATARALHRQQRKVTRQRNLSARHLPDQQTSPATRPTASPSRYDQRTVNSPTRLREMSPRRSARHSSSSPAQLEQLKIVCLVLDQRHRD